MRGREESKLLVAEAKLPHSTDLLSGVILKGGRGADSWYLRARFWLLVSETSWPENP